MATLTVGTIARGTAYDITTGLTSAAGGGDEFSNDGTAVLYCDNQDASSTTVTVVSTKTVDSDATLAVADLATTVGAGKLVAIGPFPTATFGTTVSITYSSVTSLSVCVAKPTTSV